VSVPNSYYGKASHMSADLKRMQHQVRSSKQLRSNPSTADTFKVTIFELTRMDKQGKVTVTDRVQLNVMSPRRRHEFARERPKPFHF
jgi:hypothetical protein